MSRGIYRGCGKWGKPTGYIWKMTPYEWGKVCGLCVQ